MTTLALSFNEVNFQPIHQGDGQIWLTSADLAKALDYKQVDSVTKIFNRNSDEFDFTMTQTVNLTVSNKNNELQEVKTRIFSLRGCHLVAFFARTAVAKKFRIWALDVLAKAVGQPVTKTHKSERTALHEAHALLVTKTKHLNVNEAWKLIHQRFNVDHIEDIPYEAIPVAVEYVHHLIAMYSNADKMQFAEPWRDQDVQFLMWYVPKIAKLIKNEFYPALTLLRSEYAAQMIGMAQEMACHANILNQAAIKGGMTTYSCLGGQAVHTMKWYLEK